MTHCLGYKKVSEILQQINSIYFSKMVLHNSRELRLQYEPDNLDVNKVCFAK